MAKHGLKPNARRTACNNHKLKVDDASSLSELAKPGSLVAEDRCFSASSLSLQQVLCQAAISSSVAAAAEELDAAILAACAANSSGAGGALGGIRGFWIEPTGYWSVAVACAG